MSIDALKICICGYANTACANRAPARERCHECKVGIHKHASDPRMRLTDAGPTSPSAGSKKELRS
jgi:hypothetical protein